MAERFVERRRAQSCRAVFQDGKLTQWLRSACGVGVEGGRKELGVAGRKERAGGRKIIRTGRQEERAKVEKKGSGGRWRKRGERRGGGGGEEEKERTFKAGMCPR